MAGPATEMVLMGQKMSAVLVHLDRIADFLRRAGHNSGANKIGMLSIEIVNTFSTASAELEFSVPITRLTDSTSSDDPEIGNGCNGSGQFATIERGRTHSRSITTGGGIHHEREESEQGGVVLQDTRVGHQETATNGANWAKVAALPLSSAGENSDAPSKKALVNAPSSLSEGSSTVQARFNGGLEDGQAGIVYVQGSTTRNFISFVSSVIHEGALYEIRIDSSVKATVIFQHTLHAQNFIDRNQELMGTTGRSCMGRGYKLFLGEPLEWHETLKRMNHPIRERRRLTFARSKLFGDQLTPQKWEREVASIAGAGNVDFTWIFNSGNATAVFRSTATARRVLHAFLTWKEYRAVYRDLDISYSTDPCEKPLILTTQMGGRQRVRHR